MQMASPPSRPPRAIKPVDPITWRERLDEHGAIHGHHRHLDARHGALFTEDDDILLVSFEEAGAMRHSTTGLPAALQVAGREGWSQLCLYSEGDTFFRSDAVFAYFDALIDEGFFDRFDRVVFYGAGPAGYAAAAFSVAAPGATVVLIRPLATLEPARSEWDRRYPALRRTDFTRRFGYAPEMLEGAGEAFLIYDPEVALDATHASLFALPEENLLRCRRLGPAPERDLEKMGVLLPLLDAAGHGRLDARTFHRLYRKRLEYRPYLHRVLTRLRVEKRLGLGRHWANGVRDQLSTEAKQRASS
ncbi:phosphoadenosine phosphosulfate reductase [Tropicimonas sp. TH_r6]|uniref:phosphoadenosine phosphosulfate reductase n=1 Tax=Tropicimonas sp. TH_r6 TaxID=3082085 RepID=UPI002952F01B|nr:phosphoadenosine phosphosulfate reductase [Tropicimonas sp. TH_r6]MDV7142387.1 phosphoadenosine phosphosulfate reductase [Tropicimonas sp. TH_r6]